ncbi:MAG: Ig-like domain-containing protein [Bacteroidota bacterium]
MSTSIQTSQGQTLLDIAIQYYGSIEGIWSILQLNPDLHLGLLLVPGTEVIVDSTLPVNRNISNFFANYDIDVIGGQVVLPDPNSITDPDPPEIVALSPAHLSAAVSIDADITIQFDEDIKRGVGLITMTKDGVFVQSWDVSRTDQVILTSSDTVQLLNPSISLDGQFSIYIAPNTFTDLVGNSFPGIAQDSWVFFSASFVLNHVPLHNSIDVNFNIEVGVVFNFPLVRTASIIELRQFDNDALIQSFDVSNPDEVRFHGTTLQLHEPVMTPAVKYYLVAPEGYVETPTGDLAPELSKTNFAFTMVDDQTRPLIAFVSPQDQANVDPSLQGTLFALFDDKVRFLGVPEFNLFDFDDNLIQVFSLADNTLIHAYQGNFQSVGFVVTNQLPSGKQLYIEPNFPVGSHIIDRAGNTWQGYKPGVVANAGWEFSTIGLLPHVSADDFTIESVDPNCNGAFTSIVTFSQESQVVHTFNFTEADFPQEDLDFVLMSILPGSYEMEIQATDCGGQSTDSRTVERPFAEPPTANLTYASGFVYLTVESPASYSNGEFNAVFNIKDGTGAVAFTANYDQSDMPSSVNLGSMSLVSGQTYTAELSVTAPDGQNAIALTFFEYINPCASVVFPDLSNAVDSWSDTGSAVRITWFDDSQPPIAIETVLDWLQANYPSAWQTLFDQRFKGELIDPRITRPAYQATIPASVNVSFLGPYGVETFNLGSNSLGNSERSRFMLFPDGRMFLLRRSGSWTFALHWIEDPEGNHSLGEIFGEVDMADPPNLESGTDPNNRLITDTQNTMDEVRILSPIPGCIAYPRDNEIWIYDFFTDLDRRAYTSALGNVGNPINDRRIAGGDGNDFDPYALITHNNKYESTFALDISVSPSEVVWEELTGTEGSYQWVEARYPADNQTARKWNWNPNIDYAAVTPDGKFIVAAVEGNGTRLYSMSGIELGRVIGSKNHFDLGWFKENGVYKPCVLVAMSGQSNINTGHFAGIFLKDWAAVVWDIITDVETGNRHAEFRAYKVLDWNGQHGPSGGGQASCIGLNKDFAFVSITRGDEDFTDNLIYGDQILQLAMNNDTAYPTMVVDEHMANVTNANVGQQAECGAGPISLINPSYMYCWSRARVNNASQKFHFVRRLRARPTDADITANLSS